MPFFKKKDKSPIPLEQRYAAASKERERLSQTAEELQEALYSDKELQKLFREFGISPTVNTEDLEDLEKQLKSLPDQVDPVAELEEMLKKGGKHKRTHKYKGVSYKVHVGQKGGRYILVSNGDKQKKVYV